MFILQGYNNYIIVAEYFYGTCTGLYIFLCSLCLYPLTFNNYDTFFLDFPQSQKLLVITNLSEICWIDGICDGRVDTEIFLAELS